MEAVACLDDFLLDLIALLPGDARAKRELSKVATNSDTSRFDHGRVLSWEWRALELCVVHVAHMLVSLLVAMVLLYDPVHKRGKRSVRAMRARVDTDARVWVLDSREDCLFEREAYVILGILELIPDIV